VAVLEKRFQTGHLHPGKIIRNVCDVQADDVRGVQFVYGGFPCGDICGAGSRRGYAGTRSMLVTELIKIALMSSCNHVLLENVAAILHHGMEPVICATIQLLVDSGFTEAKWCVVRAAHVGSPQHRARWFCLASRPGTTHELADVVRPVTSDEAATQAAGPWNETAALPMHEWLQERRVEGDLPRFKQMGNCVVPQQAALALRILAHV
jgi:site-specific DNA-cytosine methylase